MRGAQCLNRSASDAVVGISTGIGEPTVLRQGLSGQAQNLVGKVLHRRQPIRHEERRGGCGGEGRGRGRGIRPGGRGRRGGRRRRGRLRARDDHDHEKGRGEYLHRGVSVARRIVRDAVHVPYAFARQHRIRAGRGATHAAAAVGQLARGLDADLPDGESAAFPPSFRATTCLDRGHLREAADAEERTRAPATSRPRSFAADTAARSGAPAPCPNAGTMSPERVTPAAVDGRVCPAPGAPSVRRPIARPRMQHAARFRRGTATMMAPFDVMLANVGGGAMRSHRQPTVVLALRTRRRGMRTSG